VLGPRAAAADPLSGVRIDQLQPASPESVFFRTEGPHNPLAEGVEWAAGLTLEYGKGLLHEVVIDAAGNRSTAATLVDNALLGRVSGSITPLHWLAFDLSLPIALFETGSSTVSGIGKIHPAAGTEGVGDLRIGTHFRVVDKTAYGILLGGRVWAPFGTQATYLSDHNFRAEVDLGIAGDVGRVLYGCTLDIAPGFFAKRAGDRFAGSCAAHVKVGEIASIGLEPAFEAVTRTPISLGSQPANAVIGVIFEPLAEVRLRFGGVRLGFAVGPDFGGTMGSTPVRGLVNVAYVGLGKPPKPPVMGPPDRDLDKIPDDVDACPDEAGPTSTNPKLNGCPLHDRDGDGIRDEEDACPDRAGIPYPDPKANGCPDTDNDGLPDPIDQCVNEPGAPPTGCPKYARLVSGNFKIDPPIEFGVGEKLHPEGRAAFEEMAATLRANPGIDRLSISIGTKGVKGPLSDKRAQEILAILRAGNLDPSRYEVVLRDDIKGGQVQVQVQAPKGK
jgi:hypothetical protein